MHDTQTSTHPATPRRKLLPPGRCLRARCWVPVMMQSALRGPPARAARSWAGSSWSWAPPGATPLSGAHHLRLRGRAFRPGKTQRPAPAAAHQQAGLCCGSAKRRITCRRLPKWRCLEAGLMKARQCAIAHEAHAVLRTNQQQRVRHLPNIHLLHQFVWHDLTVQFAHT